MQHPISITIGEVFYEDIQDALVECDCGHTVLLNQAEEIWQGPKVTLICDECRFSQVPTAVCLCNDCTYRYAQHEE